MYDAATDTQVRRPIPLSTPQYARLPACGAQDGGRELKLAYLCNLCFSQDELDYLSSLRFIKSDFVDFLSVFRFQRRFIEVKADGDRLSIIARGRWCT